MTIEELLEARLAGDDPEVPPELAEDFARALAAHEAIQFAMGETILVDDVAPADGPPPALPDEYQIIRELGRGGMGVVYLAHQESLGREVAVKVLRPNQEYFAPVLKRFRDEARHLARLRHPNIVAIHEVGEVEGEPYFTMEFVDGDALSSILNRETMNAGRALETLKQVADAVDHAHRQGIIHRDLKPANILVDGAGQNYVTDFGLARNITQTSVLTQSGEVLGTPAYMAPEQARGDIASVSEATDVHAMGMILYECLTGRAPYGKDAPALVLLRLLQEDPVPPRRINARIPRDLETICMKAMAKNPAKRYATAAALREDLLRFESGQAVTARRQTGLERMLRKTAKHWRLATACAAVAILLALLFKEFSTNAADTFMALGKEYEEALDIDAALGVYRKALESADPSQRAEILERLVIVGSRYAPTWQPRSTSLAASLLAIEIDPEVDFDGTEANWHLAQTLLSSFRNPGPGKNAGIASSNDRQSLELACTRLEVFLEETESSPERKQQAGRELELLRRQLAGDGPLMQPVPLPAPPSGSLAELLDRIGDTALPVWERAQSAHAAGKALEADGQAERAITVYRRAFELYRQVCPIVDGITGALSSDYVGEARPSIIGSEIRAAAAAVERLGGDPPASMEGGLQFRIEGLDIPNGLWVGISLHLTDPDSSLIGESLEHRSGKLTQFNPDGTVTIRVADGVYHLIASLGMYAHDGTHDELTSLLQFDTGSLPDTVEIRGGVIELEPIQAHVLEAITLFEPASGTPVDLNESVFRWSPVEGADEYRVKFGYTGESSEGFPVFTSIGSVSTMDAVLAPQTLTGERVEALQDLSEGQSCFWSVEALDTGGIFLSRPPRVIGRTVNKHYFYLIQGLDR